MITRRAVLRGAAVVAAAPIALSVARALPAPAPVSEMDALIAQASARITATPRFVLVTADQVAVCRAMGIKVSDYVNMRFRCAS